MPVPGFYVDHLIQNYAFTITSKDTVRVMRKKIYLYKNKRKGSNTEKN